MIQDMWSKEFNSSVLISHIYVHVILQTRVISKYKRNQWIYKLTSLRKIKFFVLHVFDEH